MAAAASAVSNSLTSSFVAPPLRTSEESNALNCATRTSQPKSSNRLQSVVTSRISLEPFRRKGRLVSCKVNKDNVPLGTASGVERKSILCADCDGNGAVLCNQCHGDGLNTEDHFQGRFKAGTTCWLCRGKRQMLCGSCNGAGFVGGFMSAADD